MKVPERWFAALQDLLWQDSEGGQAQTERVSGCAYQRCPAGHDPVLRGLGGYMVRGSQG